MSVNVKPVPLVAQPTNRAASSGKDSKMVNCIAEQMADGTVHVLQRPSIRWLGQSGYGVTPIYGGSITFGNSSYLISGIKFLAYSSPGAPYFTHTVSSSTYKGDRYAMVAVRQSIVAGTPHDQILMIGAPGGINAAYLFQYNTNTFTDITASLGGQGLFLCGAVALDNSAYYMDQVGNVYGSNVADLSTWNPLNKIFIGGTQDFPVYLALQQNNIVAFKTNTIEFLYDAANTSGSPLARNESAHVGYMGCGSKTSIVDFGSKIVFQYHTKTNGRGFAIMENLTPRIISTPSIERLLTSNAVQAESVGVTAAGHQYYIANLGTTTVVYDLTEGLWYYWTMNGAQIVFSGIFTDRVYGDCLIDGTTGDQYQLELLASTDFLPTTPVPSGEEVPFQCDIVTPRWDGNTQVKKQCSRMDIFADVNTGSTITIQFSDDDYNTWGPTHTLDMSSAIPCVPNCGSFRRRAFWLRKNDGKAFRIEKITMNVSQGAS
jgi:hypothetical protein